ncbi:MAG: dihydrolipoyl dehydrogenase [candidate division KSB1 bacterium]|nr:dihydrolipoyl dehydrogenase [candidate division KSB1 bacterium]
MNSQKPNIAVIGGGPGGYAAAFLAADLGMQVTLIDKETHPGGVCLYRGCIPSKALLHVAHLITESREAKNWGVAFSEPNIHLDKLREWKTSVVQKMVGGLGQLAKMRKIQFIQGTATLTGSQSVHVKHVSGEEQELQFDYIVLATGSRPLTIPTLNLDSPRVMDSTRALELEEIPKSLLVIGGGYIGLELGTVYSALGSEVTVVEMTPGLLPGVDRDLVRILEARVKRMFHDVLLSTKVVELHEEPNGIRVKFAGEKAAGMERVFDRVLVSVGRRPNTENIGLENTRVELDERGFVKVNAQRRTTDPHIFAIGDIAGNPMLAHKASHEGRVAVEAIAGHRVAFEPHAIPAVVFTDPEIAYCGLTEGEAKEKNIPVEVVRFPWGASGRATTLGRNDGVTKLLIDPQTERILGVGIVGPGAGELISEGVLAVEMAALATDLKLSIHPHPTLSETLMEAAEMFFGQSTHVYRPKKKG